MTFRLFLGVSDSVALITSVCFVSYIDKSICREFLQAALLEGGSQSSSDDITRWPTVEGTSLCIHRV